MGENFATIPVDEYKKLVASARDSEILKEIICDRAERYLRLENAELRMIKTMFVGKESEEDR